MDDQADGVFIGESQAVREVLDLVDMVARSDCAVLIEGESGTGKELIARRLHAGSPRKTKPFIPVNCAGIGESLFESQFFGHVRGAFTGAERSTLGLIRTADGGTLFMDEVGDIPPELQPKLLRVLQEGEVLSVGSASAERVNTRFIAATNRSLRQQVREGSFREDLFYRLNVVHVVAPPLRERREDIPLLVDHFLARCANRCRQAVISVGAAARRQLCDYSWPGNVRELVNWVERLYATQLDPALLAAALVEQAEEDDQLPPGVLSMDQAQRSAIINALQACGQNRSKAARALGVNRGTLIRRIAQYQVV